MFNKQRRMNFAQRQLPNALVVLRHLSTLLELPYLQTL